MLKKKYVMSDLYHEQNWLKIQYPHLDFTDIIVVKLGK